MKKIADLYSRKKEQEHPIILSEDPFSSIQMKLWKERWKERGMGKILSSLQSTKIRKARWNA